jgi:ATP-dependent DNA ligase
LRETPGAPCSLTGARHRCSLTAQPFPGISAGGMFPRPIIPARREPFDHLAWAFELKLDGFRCIADTVRGRLLSKHKNRMKRFEALLESLPQGYVFDGEIVCLDETSDDPCYRLMPCRRACPGTLLQSRSAI